MKVHLFSDVYWTRWGLSWSTSASTNVDCHSCFIMTCTGWIYASRSIKAGSDRCLWNQVPTYLACHFVPVSDIAGHHHLWSSTDCTVPHIRRSTFNTEAFATAGPTVCNSLPDYLRHPTVGLVWYGLLVFNGTFSTNRLYRAIDIWTIMLCRAREKIHSNKNKLNEKNTYKYSLPPGLFGDNLLATKRCHQRSLSSQSLGKYWQLNQNN